MTFDFALGHYTEMPGIRNDDPDGEDFFTDLRSVSSLELIMS